MSARIWALCNVSPIPRMRISSIICVRSGHIFSYARWTSRQIEKPQSSRQPLPERMAFLVQQVDRICRDSGAGLVAE